MQPYQLAEDVKAKIAVTLQDGTVVISKNRVTIPAFSWVKEYGPDTKPEGER